MTRKESIYTNLCGLEKHGIIQTGWYCYNNGRGLKWVFSPCGFGERSFTTSQIEDFILGTRAALHARGDSILRRIRAVSDEPKYKVWEVVARSESGEYRRERIHSVRAVSSRFVRREFRRLRGDLWTITDVSPSAVQEKIS